MAEYIPNPIDTSDVELPEGIEELVEQLAKNTHEVWAANRIAQGWSYGEQRDDERKLHPCLVPYEELPESEKVYDRATSIESLKCIVALGYVIKLLD
ncbi:MAG: Ryanodine receptor Ryr [Ruminococcaceae bacterium]|nr:Ryanodine receptor Ryr [Oscillospiraceae bacterium]